MTYKHLTEEERYHIDDLRREGFNQKKVAEALGRSPSTILRRNKGDRGWWPRQAELTAVKRLVARGANNARKISQGTWHYVAKHLIEDQWSPEQIAGRARREGLAPMSPETIYQRILEDKTAGGRLYTHLRCKKRRKKRYGSARSARGTI